MTKVLVYNQDGQKVGEKQLKPEIFKVEVKPEIIWRVVTAMRHNARLPWAHTKTRAEVRGGGKKPWRQKGTGRARHGSIRSPLWVGGGITFGPRSDRNYSKKVNKKIRRQALLMSLSDKAANNNIVVLENLQLPEIKTKPLFQMLQNLGYRCGKKTENKDKAKTKENKIKDVKILIMTDKKDDKVQKSARNIAGVNVTAANNLNLIKILEHKMLIVTSQALAALEKIYK
ncbi:50S ribosomal protein L4 [Candidatus Parcubacteria bacterium]|nr:MAG: 50S ribosomal protein L4 [Candidatus Parcubacteria bacterium]